MPPARRADRPRTPGRAVLPDLLQATVQAPAVSGVRELRPPAAVRAERRLLDLRERAAVCTLRENRCPGRHADAVRPGVHRLHALLQAARAVRALRNAVEMALSKRGAGARPAPLSPVRASRPRDLQGVPGSARSARCGWRCHQPRGSSRWRQLHEACHPTNEYWMRSCDSRPDSRPQ